MGTVHSTWLDHDVICVQSNAQLIMHSATHPGNSWAQSSKWPLDEELIIAHRNLLNARQTHTHTNTHTYNVYTRMHPHTHSHTRTMYTHIHTHTQHTHAHTQMQDRGRETNTYTQTHTHTYYLKARSLGRARIGESMFATGVNAVALYQFICRRVCPEVVCCLHLCVVQGTGTHCTERCTELTDSFWHDSLRVK